MPAREYVFPVTEVVKVTDGDTYWLRLDVGFRHTHLTNLRLAGLDTPEINSGSPHERAEGQRAKLFVENWLLGFGRRVWVQTLKDPDNFGRWLGHVFDGDDVRLGDTLMAERLATVWPQRWRELYDGPGAPPSSAEEDE